MNEDPTILIRVMINLITEILVLFIFPRFLIRTKFTRINWTWTFDGSWFSQLRTNEMSGLVGLEIDLSHQSTCPIQLFKVLVFCFLFALYI